MPTITRRALLVGATAALASGSATAAAAAGRSAPTLSRIRQDVVAQQGNASITVSLNPVQDVMMISYTITNIGTAPDVFTVWYSDVDNGRQSRQLSYPLNPGESASAQVYGHLNHSFLVNVCQSDGTCFSVGPISPGPGPAAIPLGIRVRPPQ